MSEFEFFTGERKIDQFTLSLHSGKAQVTCTVLERWEERTARSLNCGMRRKRTLKKSIGVSSVEREELESTISGSFGLEGIAGFKSELRGKLSREISFEETREEEEEFEFAAPQCGRLIVKVYQLVRIYQLSFRDFRSWLFRKGDFFKTIVESVDRIYDRSIEIQNDPDCGCNRQPELGFDGLVTLDLGKIGMLVGYQHKKDGIEFPALGVLLKARDINEVLFHSVTLHSRAIPSHLLFLADESSSVLTGEFLPESESTLEENQEVEKSSRKQQQTKGSFLNTLGDALLLGGGLGVTIALVLRRRNSEQRQEELDELAKGINEKGENLKARLKALLAQRIAQQRGIRESKAATSVENDQAFYEGESK